MHSRPLHPQTNGKDERFHRTLKAEVLAHRHFETLAQAQAQFDHWRGVYNHERPHEALSMQPPAQRYAPSPRSLPGALPPIEYGPDDLVRKVQQGGWISFKGRQLRVSKALVGQPVALRPCIEADGLCLRSVQLRGAARSAVAIQPIRSISHHAAALLHVFGVVAGRANRVRSARDNRASIQSSGQPITLN